MSYAPKLSTQPEVEHFVRGTLEGHIDNFPPNVGADHNLQLVGVNSIDLIVVLSQLEQRLDISLEDAFVAQGYTISNIAERVLVALRHTAQADM